MTTEREESNTLPNLLKRANARMNMKTVDTSNMSPDEIVTLVHELQTHQIELEIQNEDLRRAHEELDESRNRYADLYNIAPIGYATISPQNLILNANAVLAEMLGIERRTMVKQPFSAFIDPEDQDIYYRHRQEILHKKQRSICKLRLLRWADEPMWVEMDTILVEADDKSDFRFRTTISDITEREDIYQKLEYNEKLFRTLATSAPVGIFQADAEGNGIFVNDTICSFTGLPAEAHGGRGWTDSIHPNDRDHVRQLWRKTIKGEASFDSEFRFLRKKKKVTWVKSRAAPIEDGNGHITGFIGTLNDITKKKIDEINLHKSEKKYRLLAETMADIVWTTDLEFRTRYVSPSIERILGFTAEERYQQPLKEVITPESLHAASEILLEMLNREEEGMQNPDSITVDIEYYKKDGSTVWLENNLKFIRDAENKRVGLLGVSRDITKRRKAEENFTLAQQIANIGSWEWDIVSGDFTWSDQMFQIYGYAPDEVEPSYEAVRARVYSGDLELFDKMIEQALSNKTGINFENRVVCTDQSQIWTSSRGRVICDDKGEPVRMVGTVQGITKRKRAEEALLRNEEKFRYLFESALDPVYITFRDGTFLDASPSLLTLFGYSRKELMGLKSQDLYVNPEDRSDFVKLIEKKDFVKEYRVALQTKGGKILSCIITATVRRDDQGTTLGYQGFIRDVTDKEKAEKIIFQSREELQALSTKLINAQEEERRRISLELHDEMGQSLTAISLSLTEIEEELPPDLDPKTSQKVKQLHSIISKASDQVSELSLDLRPSMLDDLGLVPTLRWHFNKMRLKTNLNINFKLAGLLERADPNIEIILYRISQEALNNIIKHADAKNVEIYLEHLHKAFSLIIKDDGIGFDVKGMNDSDSLDSEVSSQSRIGLIGMRERASIVNGTLTILSTNGHGTTIIAEIPEKYNI